MKHNRFFRLIIAFAFTLIFTTSSLQAMPTIETQAASAKLNKSKKTLYVGKTFQLKVKNSKQTFSWHTSDSSIAKINEKGLVTAVKKGSATITATSGNGKLILTCKITVKKPYVTPSKVQVLSPGQTLQMGVKGATATKYTSSDPFVASIDPKTGLLTALKGSDYYVVIKVKCDNGKTYKRNVCVIDFSFDTDDTDEVPADSDTGSQTVPSVGTDKWGLFNPQDRTPVKTSFEYTISTKQEFLEACLDAYENCAPEFTINYTSGTYDEWINFLVLLRGDYSILSGYENNINVKRYSYPANQFIISPIYKESHKASVALKHTDYDPGSVAEDILDRCRSIVETAVASSSDLKGAILAVNDEICRLTEYDYDSLNSSADPYYTDTDGVVRVVPAWDATGITNSGKAVCEGYSALFKLCMDVLGVPCHCICNTPSTHMWTRVKLDGIWYHVDVTWNDGCYNDFFLVTDSELAALDKDYGTKDHTFDNTYLPQ